jgi:DNA-binding transcriptional MerR regulator
MKPPRALLRMSALEDRTGCTRDTIHFYLKSGLLHAPRKTGATNALYDETHVDRLLRIRALRDAGISLEAMPALLAALEGVPLAVVHSIGLVLSRTLGVAHADHASAALEPELRGACETTLATIDPLLVQVADAIAEAVAGAFEVHAPDRTARLLEAIAAAASGRLAAHTARRVEDRVIARMRSRRASRRRD